MRVYLGHVRAWADADQRPVNRVRQVCHVLCEQMTLPAIKR